MNGAGAGTIATIAVLAFVGLLACGFGVLELRLWFRPWGLIGYTRGPKPTLLGGVLWLLVGGLILYVVASFWFRGIPE